VAAPAAGEVAAGTTVALSTATAGAEIYYTTDGTAPDSGKTKYTEPIAITTAATIKAIAVKTGWTNSGVLTADYTVAAAPGVAALPSASPAAGEVAAGTTVALSTATEGAEIYYTTDGSAPDNTKTKYTAPVAIAGAMTIKAVAVKAGWTNSPVLTATYSIVAQGAAARPSATPPSGEVTAGTTVALSTATEGAEIYYTTNGTAPDSTKTKYTAPIAITAAVTVKAIAVKDGLTNSSVLTAEYTIAVPGAAARPFANPPAGEVDAGTEVALTTATEGADIYFTTDGTAPGSTKTKYTAPISITAPVTIRAVAIKDGLTNSAVLTAAYAIAPVPDTTAPAEVSGLGGSAGNGQARLTWTDPEDADLDHIAITWTGGSDTAAKSTAANRANSKTIPGLTNGTAYAFTVKTVDRAGNESEGQTFQATPADTIPPAEASGLSGAAGSAHGQAVLTWTDPADPDFDHIAITWTGGSDTAAKSTAANRANSKTIGSLTARTAFTVKTVDAAGNASAGRTVSAAPYLDGLAPANVSGLAGAVGNAQITLTWTDPADADFASVTISFTPEAEGVAQPVSVA
jgi:transcription elongation GreA/GreB family factor